jgi:4-amino-4-deoxy-L-arabinose transferase-like glycosyltransferase
VAFLANLKSKLSPWSVGLILLTALISVEVLYRLDHGVRSEYYAAIARSMSVNPSNFFFGALDSTATYSLDKIPGSYWLPAIFVRIFGFSTWSVLAPNALAAIASVIIMSVAVRRIAGVYAGLLAGLVVASTPILVAVSRSNQPESAFVLVLSCVALAATKAFQTGKLSHLIYLGLWVALAFDFYMLEAWATWPAIAIAWFFVAKPLLAKVRDLAVAGVLSLSASLIWPTITLLTASANRPYIGGTLHNNPFEMIFGYNGLGRFGLTLGFSQDAYKTYAPTYSGSASTVRFFNLALAGQIGWLLPTALLAFVLLIWLKFCPPIMVFFGSWLVTLVVMFSSVAGMHQFYTASVALPMAAIIGVTFVVAFNKRATVSILLLLLATVLMLNHNRVLYHSYHKRYELIQMGVLLVAAALVVYRRYYKGKFESRILIATASAVVLGLMISPLSWALEAYKYPSSLTPAAGRTPSQAALERKDPVRAKKMVTQGVPQPEEAALIKFAEKNAGHGRYDFATFGGIEGATFITSSSLSVLPIGGFNGSDAYPNLEQFKQIIASGNLRYVMQSSGLVSAARSHTLTKDTPDYREIATWVAQSCAEVSYLPLKLQSVSARVLFDCSTAVK